MERTLGRKGILVWLNFFMVRWPMRSSAWASSTSWRSSPVERTYEGSSGYVPIHLSRVRSVQVQVRVRGTTLYWVVRWDTYISEYGVFSSILKSVPGVLEHSVAAMDLEPCLPQGYSLHLHFSWMTFSTMLRDWVYYSKVR